MILATAGHVDHGKSTLVRMLTGTDPDRWDEEKRRGLTIDLGFARLVLDDGTELDVIDVPGHQRFLPNMLAGCGAVDLVLFVVSAREGWSAQSDEHLRILHSYGAREGVIALTHSDTISQSQLEATSSAVAQHLTGTSLEGSPIVATSATNLESIAQLRSQISATVARMDHGTAGARPRMWIDRSFNVRGAGRVVTGTLSGGPLEVGQTIDLITDSSTSRNGSTSFRVRGLHRFDTAHRQIGPGVRVGVNLAGAKVIPHRGDALAHPHQWAVTQRLHVALDLPPSGIRPAPNSSYQLFIGTTHRPAQLRYPVHQTQPTEGAVLARVHLARPLGPIAPGDRFVLRDAGNGTTVGGGVVLACDHKPISHQPQILVDRYRAIISSTRHRTVAGGLSTIGELGTTLLSERAGAWPADEFQRLTGSTLLDGTRVVGSSIVDVHALHACIEEMQRSIARNPDGIGQPVDLLGCAAVDQLIETGVGSRQGGRVVALGVSLHDQAVASAGTRALIALDSAVPPLLTRDELRNRAGITGRYLTDLVEREVLIEIPPFWTTPDRAKAWVATVTATISSTPSGVTTSGLRKALGLSRRYTLALLEWCDSQGITVRNDNLRRLI